jgi:hypothetical protein
MVPLGIFFPKEDKSFQKEKERKETSYPNPNPNPRV